MIGGHGDTPGPGVFDLKAHSTGEKLRQLAPRPGAVQCAAQPVQIADGADDQASGAVAPVRRHNWRGVPATLAAGKDRRSFVILERPCRHLEIMQRRGLERGHAGKAQMVGIGGDQEPLGPHLPVRRFHLPDAAVMAGARDFRRRVNFRPGGLGGASQSQAVGERLDGAGTGVVQRTRINLRTGAPRGLGAVQERHRRAQSGELAAALPEVLESGGIVRQMQRAGAHRLAVDLVFLDQVEYPCRRVAEDRCQPLSGRLAECLRNRVRCQP